MEGDSDQSQGVRSALQRRRLAIIAGAVAGAVLLVAGLAFWLSRPKPGPGESLPPAQYREAVSAFYIGTMAMNVGDNQRAAAKLARSTEVAPTEPAGWANLGLFHLRSGNFDAASRELEKAHQLAPQSAEVQMLLGLLAGKRGDFARSITHFRRATDLDTKHLRARYALVTSLERQGGAGADEEVARQLAEILRVQPDNLAILLDAARVAVRRGDPQQAREFVERIGRHSNTWPEPTKARLEALRQAVTAADVRAAAAPVAFLRNMLMQQPEFRAHVAAVQSPPEQVGQPIERFLTLPTPSPTHAPSDESLTFNVTALQAAGGPSTSVTVAWLDRDGPPTLFAANAKEVRPLDADPPPLPFPGRA